MMKKLYFTILLMIFISACGNEDKKNYVELTSLISVISTPEKYENKEITVEGYFFATGESFDLLFHSREGLNNFLGADAINIFIEGLGDTGETKMLWACHSKKVRLSGVSKDIRDVYGYIPDQVNGNYFLLIVDGKKYKGTKTCPFNL